MMKEQRCCLDRDEYKKYLHMLADELQQQGVTGEILVTADVVVIVDIREPEIRKDIHAYLAGDKNAIYIPTEIDAYFGGHGATTRQAIAMITERENLPVDWFNDALRELFLTSSSEKWLERPGLRIFVPVLEHALAMLVVTADRTRDIEDIRKLASKLNITTTRALQASVIRYITKQLLTPDIRLTIREACKKARKRTRVKTSEQS